MKQYSLRFIIFFALLLINYYYILDNHFLGDDIIRLVKTLDLKSPYHALTGGLADRPLLVLLMWLEKSLFGLNPGLFRIVNLLFQSFASLQLYLLILELYGYRGREIDQKSRLWASFIALLFALHPLHGQSIYIVIQGGVVLAGLFAIVSIRYFFRWIYLKQKHSLLFCFLALLLSVLFKPIASFLPFFYIFVSLQMNGVKFSSVKPLIVNFIVLLIPVLYYLVLGKNNQASSLGSLQYFLVQTEVLFTYFRLILLPVNLQYLHDFIPPQDLWMNINWLFLLIHIGLVFIFWKFVEDKLYRILGVGFYFSFLPESSFFAINHLAFEHRTYLAIAFFFILIGLTVIENKSKLEKLFKPLGLLLLASYFILGQTRNFQIKPETNWMLHNLENSYRDHDYNFGSSLDYLKKGDPELLEPILDRYRRLYSSLHPYQLIFLINRYYREGKNKNILIKIGNELKKGELTDNQRLLVNDFFVGEMALLIKSQEETLIIEDVLFSQFPYFLESINQFEGKLRFYKDFARHMLIYADKEGKDQIDISRNLRIKATLVHYFGFKYDYLETSIHQQLKLNPESPDLKTAYRLLFLTRDQKSILKYD